MKYTKKERTDGMEYIRKEISVNLDSLVKGLMQEEQVILFDQIISDLQCRIDCLKDEEVTD